MIDERAARWSAGAVSIVGHVGLVVAFVVGYPMLSQRPAAPPAQRSLKLFMLTADSPAARPVASLARSRTAPIEPVSVAVSPPSDGKSPTPAPQNVTVREAAAIHEEEYAARPDFFRYNQLLLEHIRPFHRYPDAARGRAVQGVVLIGFLMRRDGVVPEAWVETSSGSGDLDTAALATIRQAQPFPHIPAGLPDSLTMTIPLSYTLAGSARLQ